MKTRLRLTQKWVPAMVLVASAMAPLASAQGGRAWRETSLVATPRGAWTGEHLLDGQPDVSGHWSNTIGNHNNLTDPQGLQGGNDEAAARNGRRTTQSSERAPSR